LADSLGLPFPILSDFPDLQVIRSYGVMQQVGDPPRPFARRAFFLIDKDGIIRGKWLAEKNEVFPSQPILELALKLAKM
jgi:peroxiredoxin